MLLLSLTYVSNYIVHLWRANTRHGTHSPFVYHLLDKVVYDRQPCSGAVHTKADQLIMRLLHHFQVKEILTIGTVGNELLRAIREEFGQIQMANMADKMLTHSTGVSDFILIDLTEAKGRSMVGDMEAATPFIGEQSILVIKGLYRDKDTQALWQHIYALPHATVTIDLFHIGLVFFHTTQTKEHFCIRM